MKIFKILAAAAVVLNALPLVADAHQSRPDKPAAQHATKTPYCAKLNRGLYDICLREARGDRRRTRLCGIRYRDNMKSCQPGK